MRKEEMKRLQGLPIVFYDGTCGFCQASIQIALKHNTQSVLLGITPDTSLSSWNPGL
jgi:predicted DCC family thiol-disulfide oxidoreductase YuxK